MHTAYGTIALHFLRLTEGACRELVAAENAHFVLSDVPIDQAAYDDDAYDEATRWSDHSIGVAVLFNFYHGVELLLKGFMRTSSGSKSGAHKLSQLLRAFEQSQGQVDLGSTLARRIRAIDPTCPMGEFLAKNAIGIDEWYEALKYPESLRGKVYTHRPLKYGDEATVPFWQALGEDAKRLRLQAVELSRKLGYC